MSAGSNGAVLTIVSGAPTWQTPPTPGNVSGPVSSTDNAITRWNGTGGIAIQDSGIILDDSNNITGIASLQTANQGGLILRELTASGTNAVTLRAAGTISSDYTITLPAAAPGSNTYLKYDGTDYVWATASGGGTWGAITGTLADQVDLNNALNTKVPTSRTLAGLDLSANRSASDIKTALSLTKSDVGLGNVDNTSDANKPISTATQTALDTKAPLADSKVIQIAISDETTPLTTGVAKITFRMPYAMTLSAVRASLSTAQTSGSTFTVDINESGSSILSTKLTLDNTEKTSATAASPAVISDSSLADDAEITIDIDQVGDGTAAGLKITLIGS
jgi:hypothetical protein